VTSPFKIKDFSISSPFGKRTIGGRTEIHKGIDLVCREPYIVATEDALVVSSRIVTDKSDRTWEWGNYIALSTESGLCLYFCHLDSRGVKKGDRVKKGEVIGIMGNTGYSFGRHLHFEVRREGVSVSPAEYLGIYNMTGKAKEKKMNREEILRELGDSFIGRFESLPEWAKPEVRELLDKGIINGGTEGDGEDINMFLSDIKTLIIAKRIKEA